MPAPAAGSGRYMAGLDGLRALAVLAVIAYHLNLGWASGGLLGVGVFFVLSGYLITDLLLAEWRANGSLALDRFWVRRARRLLPALWVMLVWVLLWLGLTQPARLPALGGDLVAAFLYLSNWWYVVHHVSYFATFGPPSPLGHLWSLAIEEQFYLLWPLFLVVVLRWLRWRWSLLVLALIGMAVSAWAMSQAFQPGVAYDRAYYGTDTRAFELLGGAALAVVWPSRNLRKELAARARLTLEVLGAAALLLIGFMVWYSNEYQSFLYRGGLVILTMASMATVAALAHPATRLARVLGIRPLRWIGVRSYGIYLWHFPVIVLTTPLVDVNNPSWLRGAVQVGVCLTLAALSWRFIEEPIRRLGVRALISRARATRWSTVPWPASLWEAATAIGLVGFLGASSTTRVATMSTVAQAPQQAVSVRVPVADGARRCAGRAPAAPPPAAATASPQQPPQPPQAAGVTAIGDSIMIDAAPYLQAMLPGVVIDGVVSRQMSELPNVIAQLRSQRRLEHQLVVELGTNGPFDKRELVSALNSLGPMDRIVLVNTSVPRSWERYVNDTLASAASEVPRTMVADWFDASSGRPDYFYPDGVHPDPQGARVLAGLIAQAIAPRSTPAASPAAATPSSSSATTLCSAR